jgi:hypothetical protein
MRRRRRRATIYHCDFDSHQAVQGLARAHNDNTAFRSSGRGAEQVKNEFQ